MLLALISGEGQSMISTGSGEWTGSAPPVPAMVVSTNVAGKGAVEGAGAFSDVMRESSQRVQRGNKEAVATAATADSTEARSSSNVATEQDCGAAGQAEGRVDETGFAADSQRGLNGEAKVTPTDGVDVVVSPKSAMPVVTGNSHAHLPDAAKAPAEERGKGRTNANSKATDTGTSIGASSACDGSAAGGGVVEAVAPCEARQDMAVKVEDKTSKTKAPPAGDGTAAAVVPANASMSEDGGAKSDHHDGIVFCIEPEALSAGGGTAEPPLTAGVQGVAAAAAQVHSINAVQGAAAAQGREASAGAAVSANGQSVVPGELTLSSYNVTKTNQLEVGLQGGEYGWLKVRAEMGSNGEVNAYLRGGSPSATDLLQAQAPRIAAYLGAADVAVRSVQVEPVQLSHGHASASPGFVDDGRESAGSDAKKQRSADGGKDSREMVDAGMTHADRPGEDFVPAQLMMNQNATVFAGTGSWLSVRA